MVDSIVCHLENNIALPRSMMWSNVRNSLAKMSVYRYKFMKDSEHYKAKGANSRVIMLKRLLRWHLQRQTWCWLCVSRSWIVFFIGFHYARNSNSRLFWDKQPAVLRSLPPPGFRIHMNPQIHHRILFIQFRFFAHCFFVTWLGNRFSGRERCPLCCMLLSEVGRWMEVIRLGYVKKGIKILNSRLTRIGSIRQQAIWINVATNGIVAFRIVLQLITLQLTFLCPSFFFVCLSLRCCEVVGKTRAHIDARLLQPSTSYLPKPSKTLEFLFPYLPLILSLELYSLLETVAERYFDSSEPLELYGISPIFIRKYDPDCLTYLFKRVFVSSWKTALPVLKCGDFSEPNNNRLNLVLSPVSSKSM